MQDTNDNRKRATRCHKAIMSYGDDLPESNLIDFLADAMPWTRLSGRSFADLFATAQNHYETETNQPRGELP